MGKFVGKNHAGHQPAFFYYSRKAPVNGCRVALYLQRFRIKSGLLHPYDKKRRRRPAIPTKPVPSNPSVLGSGTAAGGEPVVAKPVRAQPPELSRTQM